MAQITLEIPNDKLDRVIDALTYNYNPNMGVTKAQYARKIIKDHFKSLILSLEEEQQRKSITVEEIDINVT